MDEGGVYVRVAVSKTPGSKNGVQVFSLSSWIHQTFIPTGDLDPVIPTGHWEVRSSPQDTGRPRLVYSTLNSLL